MVTQEQLRSSSRIQQLQRQSQQRQYQRVQKPQRVPSTAPDVSNISENDLIRLIEQVGQSGSSSQQLTRSLRDISISGGSPEQQARQYVLKQASGESINRGNLPVEVTREIDRLSGIATVRRALSRASTSGIAKSLPSGIIPTAREQELGMSLLNRESLELSSRGLPESYIEDYNPPMSIDYSQFQTRVPEKSRIERYKENLISIASKVKEAVAPKGSFVREKVLTKQDLSFVKQTARDIKGEIKTITTYVGGKYVEPLVRIYFKEDERQRKQEQELNSSLQKRGTFEIVSGEVSEKVKEVSKQVIPNLYFGEGGIPVGLIPNRKTTLTGFAYPEDTYIGRLTDGKVIRTNPFIKIEEKIRKQSVVTDTSNSLKGESIGDFGSYFIPVIGQTRIGLDLGFIGEKVISGKSLTGREMFFAGATLIGGGAIIARRSGYLLTKSEKLAFEGQRARIIAEQGAFNIERESARLQREKFNILGKLQGVDPFENLVKTTPRVTEGIGLQTLSARESKIISDFTGTFIKEVPSAKKIDSVSIQISDQEIFKIARESKAPKFEALSFLEDPIKTTNIAFSERLQIGKSTVDFGGSFRVGSRGQAVDREFFITSIESTKKGGAIGEIIKYIPRRKSTITRIVDDRFVRVTQDGLFGSFNREQIIVKSLLRKRVKRREASLFEVSRRDIPREDKIITFPEFIQMGIKRPDKKILTFPSRDKKLFVEAIGFTDDAISVGAFAEFKGGIWRGEVASALQRGFRQRTLELPKGTIFIEGSETIRNIIHSGRKSSTQFLQQMWETQKPILLPSKKPTSSLVKTVRKPKTEVLSKNQIVVPTTSAFAGTGLYERTEETLQPLSMLGVTSFSGVDTRQREDVILQPVIETKSQEKLITSTIQVSKQIQEPLQQLKSSEVSKQVPSNTQIPIQVQYPRQIPTPILRPPRQIPTPILRPPRQIPTPILRPPRPRPPRPPNPPEPKIVIEPLRFGRSKTLQRLAQKVEEEGIFEVFGRVKGKDILLKRTRDQAEAERGLAKFLKGTIGAGGFIQTSKGKIALGELNLLKGKEFRTGKSDSLRIIQKKEFRLGTRSEVKEIQTFKSQSSSKKKRTKKSKNNLFGL